MTKDDKITAACLLAMMVGIFLVLALPLMPKGTPTEHFWPETLVQYAQVFSPLATLAAVCTSLYIALRIPKPSLSINAGHRILLTPGDPDRTELVAVEVTNVGSNDVEVANVGWRAGHRGREGWAIQNVDFGPGAAQSSKLPIRLKHGEKAHYFYRAVGPVGWLSQIEEDGFMPEVMTSRSMVDTLRVAVWTTVGSKPFLRKPESTLLDKIWSRQSIFLAKQITSAAPTTSHSRNLVDGGEPTGR